MLQKMLIVVVILAIGAGAAIWYMRGPSYRGPVTWIEQTAWDGPMLGMAFPPVTDARDRRFTHHALAGLGIRHIRFAENWKRRGLTPEAGDFSSLVKRVRGLRAAGFNILLTVQSDGPDAACGTRGKHGCTLLPEAPFEAYLDQLLHLVGDDITAIQFGNEWENQFPGTADEFLALHQRFARTVRAARPELPIVLGGITGRAPYAYALCERNLTMGIPDVDEQAVRAPFCSGEMEKMTINSGHIEQVMRNADYDIMDVHLYDAHALWPAAVDWVRARAGGRPIWVTEFGGPNPDIEPDNVAYHARRLALYLDTLRSLPVERAYYFKLTDDPSSYHDKSGLYTMFRRPKPALEVFRKAVLGTKPRS